MNLLQRARRWWRRWVIDVRPTGVLARKNAVIRSLHQTLGDLRAREWAGRREVDRLREELAIVRAHVLRFEARGAGEIPPAPGVYLVWLAGGRQWHEAHWSAAGWRVLTERRSPVCHWRPMPLGPAERLGI